MDIEFKPIPNEIPRYMAGSDGFVYAVDQGFPIIPVKPQLDDAGYWRVSLRDSSGKNRTRTVHSLICSAYHGERPAGLEVRHLDGVRKNNKPLNLVWGTKFENGDDKATHNEIKKERKRHTILSFEQRNEISTRLSIGASGRSLAKEFGVAPETVKAIKRHWEVGVGFRDDIPCKRNYVRFTWRRCQRQSRKTGVPFFEEWKSYDRFIQDVGERPSDNHFLTVSDWTIGYAPGNCTWETKEKQMQTRPVRKWSAQNCV